MSLGLEIVWLPITLLAIVAVGCNSVAADDPMADHSFVNQQPCASPCRYGLEPDKSSASDVNLTLLKLQFVDPTTISEGGFSWLGDDSARQVSFGCLHPKNAACGGSLVVFHDVLKKVTLNITNALTFQQAAAVLGQPDYIDPRPFSPEGGGCVIALIWSKKGIYLTSIELNNERNCQTISQTGHVDPTVTVSVICYVSLEGFTPGHKNYFPEEVPWPGFSGS
jgi:hypothetical protein